MNNELVYLDNSSATRLDEKVFEAMKPYFFEKYAVASSEFGYSLGIEAKEALGKSRSTLSDRLRADREEIIFTSGSTESSNLAIKGVVESMREKGKDHIITSKVEDFPVLKTVEKLEKEGFKSTFLDVDEEGFVNLDQLQDSLTDKTALVSIQHANQEIGTVQDISKIADICKKNDTLFHTDATHTFTRLPIDVKNIPIDLITVSAHTIHGPKGIGALYVRENTPLKKQIDGGFQEYNLRAGLENVAGAVGFSKAIELVNEEENDRLRNMRDHLIEQILSEIPDTTLNGPKDNRIPQNANITFHYVEGESITLHLDMKGFAVSTGSACFSRSLEASHVILGIGGDHERAHGSVRFSFGRYNRMGEVDKVVEALKEVVMRLRDISPLGKKDV